MREENCKLLSEALEALCRLESPGEVVSALALSAGFLLGRVTIHGHEDHALDAAIDCLNDGFKDGLRARK